MMFSDLTPTQQELVNTAMTLTFEHRMQVVEFIKMQSNPADISIQVEDQFQVEDNVG